MQHHLHSYDDVIRSRSRVAGRRWRTPEAAWEDAAGRWVEVGKHWNEMWRRRRVRDEGKQAEAPKDSI